MVNLDRKYTAIIAYPMQGIVTAADIYVELNKQFDRHIIDVSLDVDASDYPTGK
jgi:hypothetical protein